MRAKPITSSACVVAALDGAPVRYLCRDSRHGHWVVTTDPHKAARFASQPEALDAARGYQKIAARNYHARAGDWRAYAVTLRLTFAELEAEAA